MIELVTTMGVAYDNLTIGKRYKLTAMEKHYVTILDDNQKEMELPQWMVVFN
jgi:uncharacterized protein YifE (UPF0438 family)